MENREAKICRRCQSLNQISFFARKKSNTVKNRNQSFKPIHVSYKKSSAKNNNHQTVKKKIYREKGVPISRSHQQTFNQIKA